MKISSLQENLKQGLFTVGHVAGKNINLPILNNILIEAKEGNIRLVATNLEIGVINTIRGKVEEEGAFTVESKIISDYISLLPNSKVDIELKEKELAVECGNYKTKILGMSAEEFPLIPLVEKKFCYVANTDELRKALSQTAFAVSNSENRMELTGILFSFSGSRLVLAATDSYRLAEKEIQVRVEGELEGELDKIIIPSRTAQEIVRIISGLKDSGETENSNETKLYISDNQILLTLGNIELVSRLIEGQYPDYRQIIPAISKTNCIINKNELVRAVKAAALFSKTGINDINLDFPQGKNQLIVSSASGASGENITELESAVSGDDNGVVVNYRYLLDGINNIDTENIKIEVIDANTPCILRPERGEGYLYIIMPIKQ